MIRSVPTIAAIYMLFVLFACNNSKPKPTSADVTKQTIRVNGKKDSVINNAKKNYGNATIADPCIRCLVRAVQLTAEYKQNIAGVEAKRVIYKINWVIADGTVDTLNTKGATNALRVDVVDKGQKGKNLSAFIYDNSIAKLYFLKNNLRSGQMEVKIDSVQLKKIRNACYWGVASGK
ncbi:hypothetical protein [Mucilaginibacter glaciei]|uniref:Lipoprotein n=1 Tax=Mucilaginibacter glaciei TaxID=2772109 RepID=A0A926NUG0_9SPHI|nr:hypothetical protein [Mucilaginibacter glaciei]MBD1391978.1 hypothetical protein [Mucilaginibacter glaciei]